MPDFKSIGNKIWREMAMRILRATVVPLEPPAEKQGEIF